MAKGMPAKAKVGTPGKTVAVGTATYFLARRMENAGLLNRGHALMLAATLPNSTPPQASGKPKRGKR